ncbi:hypothetical protein ACFQ7F_45740 [Streptomyces sp. NPDC056486]|uniref:hypothetical protein n=1 Tax=Streptomyces sp. NPDC056486 TaxID=3345835 RepID=UPI0036833A87
MSDISDIDVYLGLDVGKGEHHTQAPLYLARRRADVLFAMLHDGTFYQPPTPLTP